jgi:glycosyltransferase involved in cell wall biosynthesis
VSVDFHLVVPCFEESQRLPTYLSDLVRCLGDRPYRTRLLVVDDGSGTEEQQRLRASVRQFADSRNPVVAVDALPRNMGKGYAVRHGWTLATNGSRWLAFADADGATPAYEVARVFDIAYANADERRCYFGARVRMLGRTIHRRRQRHVIGRIYATMVSLLVDDDVYDSQCGFKVIPAEAFTRIAGALRENRFAFDCELIAALEGAGYRMDELPIDWTDVPGSKVSMVKDPVRMAFALWKIYDRKKRGSYRPDGTH